MLIAVSLSCSTQAASRPARFPLWSGGSQSIAMMTCLPWQKDRSTLAAFDVPRIDAAAVERRLALSTVSALIELSTNTMVSARRNAWRLLNQG